MIGNYKYMKVISSKKAFTLFEVLVSLVILSVMMLLLLKFFTKEDQIQKYYELQKIENNYIQTQ